MHRRPGIVHKDVDLAESLAGLSKEVVYLPGMRDAAATAIALPPVLVMAATTFSAPLCSRRSSRNRGTLCREFLCMPAPMPF